VPMLGSTGFFAALRMTSLFFTTEDPECAGDSREKPREAVPMPGSTGFFAALRMTSLFHHGGPGMRRGFGEKLREAVQILVSTGFFAALRMTAGGGPMLGSTGFFALARRCGDLIERGWGTRIRRADFYSVPATTVPFPFSASQTSRSFSISLVAVGSSGNSQNSSQTPYGQ
jgi:hypothetical protein